MSKKLKHSKIKNTGVLFEVLTRQITSDILSNKESKSVNLVRKYFNKNTALGKELQLYEILTKERYNSEERANRLIDAVLKERAQITNSSLRREKFNLIKDTLNLSVNNANSGDGRESLNVKFDHDLDISFNSRYLIDVASQLDGDKIEIFFIIIFTYINYLCYFIIIYR